MRGILPAARVFFALACVAVSTHAATGRSRPASSREAALLPEGWRQYRVRNSSAVFFASGPGEFVVYRLPVFTEEQKLVERLKSMPRDGRGYVNRILLGTGETFPYVESMVDDVEDSQRLFAADWTLGYVNVGRSSYRLHAVNAKTGELQALVTAAVRHLQAIPAKKQPWVETRDGILSVPLPEGFYKKDEGNAWPDAQLHLENRRGGSISIWLHKKRISIDSGAKYRLRAIMGEFLNGPRRANFGACRTQSPDDRLLANGWRAASGGLRCESRSGRQQLTFMAFNPGGPLYAVFARGVPPEFVEQIIGGGRLASVRADELSPLPSGPASRRELPPLPTRSQDSGALVLAAFVLLAIVGFVFQATASKDIGELPASSPEWMFPLSVQTDPFSLSVVFEVNDNRGAGWKAEGNRPTLGIFAGIALFASWFLIGFLLRMAGGPGVSMPGWWGAITTLCVFGSAGLVVIGFAASLLIPRTLELYQGEEKILILRQRWFSFPGLDFDVTLADGRRVLSLHRKRFTSIRRRWQVLDLAGNVGLEIVEDSLPKALLRKMVGHVWGLLRTNYNLTAGGRGVGFLRRRISIRNRFHVWLDPSTGIDPRLATAAVLCVDLIDVDRWYPWPS
jgi:hypothetical protein